MGEILPIAHSSLQRLPDRWLTRRCPTAFSSKPTTPSRTASITPPATYSVDNGGYVAPPLPAYPLSFNRGNCSLRPQAQRVLQPYATTCPSTAVGLIEGWQITDIVSAHTGLPFTVMCGFDCVRPQPSRTAPSLPKHQPRRELSLRCPEGQSQPLLQSGSLFAGRPPAQSATRRVMASMVRRSSTTTSPHQEHQAQ